MNTTTVKSITQFKFPCPNIFERIAEWFNRPKPVSVQSILAAAEKGQLNAHLTEHYSNYYDWQWREYLLLCRDLVDAGYLKAEFELYFDGSPIFIRGEPRITIAGRKYLAELREKHWVRRLLGWVFGFVSNVVKSLAG